EGRPRSRVATTSLGTASRSDASPLGRTQVLEPRPDVYLVDPSQLSFDIGQVTMNACLAHDIGNPPFGHAGEKAIGLFFESSMPSHFLQGLSENERNNLIKFEGNAQGFRW